MVRVFQAAEVAGQPRARDEEAAATGPEAGGRADLEHRLGARERELRALAAEKDVLAEQARAAWALLDERSAAAHEVEVRRGCKGFLGGVQGFSPTSKGYVVLTCLFRKHPTPQARRGRAGARRLGASRRALRRRARGRGPGRVYLPLEPYSLSNPESVEEGLRRV